jgi:DNA-binding NtrC family response regulator
VPIITAGFLNDLARHDWPGNVRELMNVLERFIVQHHAGLPEASFANHLIGKPASIPNLVDLQTRVLPRSDGAAERRFLETELAAAGGNISRLARKLGISRSTLRYRITLHKILRENPQD